MPKAPKTLLEPEYEADFNSYKETKSPEAAGKLLDTVKPVLNEAVRTYGGASAGSPTLFGKAKRMALGAFDAYDPSRAKLRTHLLYRLQSLRRSAAREERPIRAPEGLMLDRRRALSAENELRDSLGRDPSAAELADHTGLSMRRLHKARSVPTAYASGTFSGVNSEGEYNEGPSVISGPNDGARKAWLEFVYHDLAPRDQLILEHSLGLHGRPVLENRDLAKKLGVSPGAISQRRNVIQELLDRDLSSGVFSS